jgi:hypothetical protein
MRRQIGNTLKESAPRALNVTLAGHRGFAFRLSADFKEIPNRLAVLRMASGLRPVFCAMASRSSFCASAISSRSDAHERANRFAAVAIKFCLFFINPGSISRRTLVIAYPASTSTRKIAARLVGGLSAICSR